MTQRIDIVFNPNAGRGRAAARVERLSAELVARRFTPRTFTLADFFATQQTEPCDAVIALGGDGTARAVVEALATRFADAAPPVAFLPLGTANLLARHLHLPWTADDHWPDLFAALATRRTRAIDLATANGKLFLLMCSVGFDAQVVHEVAAARTGPITKLNYVPALARSLLNHAPAELKVTIDGKRVFGPDPALVVVANAAEYGTGFSMNPNAASDDGALDVTIFQADSPAHLLNAALHAVTGQIDHGAAIVATGRSIRIDGPAAPAQIDGEAFGTTPVQIELLPFRQSFIVGLD